MAFIGESWGSQERTLPLAKIGEIVGWRPLGNPVSTTSIFKVKR